MSGPRIGIIGTGQMAARMARTINASPAIILAVLSHDQDRANGFASRHNIARRYTDQDVFLADEELDLIYIANASRHHAKAAVASLNAGKHVLCEKPFARDIAEADLVLEAAGQSGRFFMEALWTMSLPAYQRFGQLAQSNDMGEPNVLRFDFGYPVHKDYKAGLMEPQNGGILFDRACYGVALAIKTMGSISAVQAQAVGGSVNLQMTHEGGELTQIAVSADALLANRIFLGCSRGMIGVDPPSLAAETVWHIRHDMSPPEISDGSLSMKDRLSQSAILRRLRGRLKMPSRHWLPYGADQYSPMLDNVLASIASGKTSSDHVPHDLSHATVSALALAEQYLKDAE